MHVRIRRRILAALAAFSVFASLVSCSSSQPGASDAGLWRDFQIGALEADPPGSLRELTDRSTLIVRGVVQAVEAGPSTGPEEGPRLTTVAVVVSVAT